MPHALAHYFEENRFKIPRKNRQQFHRSKTLWKIVIQGAQNVVLHIQERAHTLKVHRMRRFKMVMVLVAKKCEFS